MTKQFQLSLEKETLIFSAAHFITFGEGICESLHGHNYRVACRVSGQLDDHSCVVDFIWLRDTLKSITTTLDHKVLLPDRHPEILVENGETEITASYRDRRWLFPKQDVVMLPVDNTTAERLAEYIGGKLHQAIQAKTITNLTSLSVGVDENEGQWAWCEILGS